MIQQERQFLTPNEYYKVLNNISKPYHPFINTCPNHKSPQYGCGRGLKVITFFNKIVPTFEVCFKKHDLPTYLKKSSIHNISSFSNGPTNSTEVEPEERSPNHVHYTPTVDQHKYLFTLLQQSSPTNTAQVLQFHFVMNNTSGILPSPLSFTGKRTWILNIEASDRVFHCQSLYQTIFTINSIAIKFPNDHIITTNRCSTTFFTNDLYLINVFIFLNFLRT